MKTLIHCFFIATLIVVISCNTEQPEKPKVTIPSGPNVVFVETFQDGLDKWVQSNDDKYNGKFVIKEANEPIKIEGEEGLVVDAEARHYGIVANFDKVLDNKDKELVVQYEVRLMKGLQCGGAYIKLLTKEFLPKDLETFNDKTPYTIMFGPDKCGTNDKVHFIFRHKNPVSKEWEEKHLNKTSSIKSDTLTHLYTLHVMPDNKYEVFIDGESISSGSLLENFNPPVNPPEEIDDPTDKKPEDWVDDAQIPDPSASKPDDWDENAPATIIDSSAVKPAGWLDNEPLKIPDPNAPKPADWDDELDGEYEAQTVDNPKCDEIGCGPWEPPHIPNPDYKGKWSAPLIPNPAYIGEWRPKQIKNPHYFVDEHPYHFAPMGGVGIEIWTMQDGIMFDNFLITYDKKIADKFAEETFFVKSEEEKRLKSINEPKESFVDSALKQINSAVEAGIIYARDEKNLPVVIVSLVAGIVIPIIFCCCLGGKKKKQVIEEEVDGNEETDDLKKDDKDGDKKTDDKKTDNKKEDNPKKDPKKLKRNNNNKENENETKQRKK